METKASPNALLMLTEYKQKEHSKAGVHDSIFILVLFSIPVPWPPLSEALLLLVITQATVPNLPTPITPQHSSSCCPVGKSGLKAWLLDQICLIVIIILKVQLLKHCTYENTEHGFSCFFGGVFGLFWIFTFPSQESNAMKWFHGVCISFFLPFFSF